MKKPDLPKINLQNANWKKLLLIGIAAVIVIGGGFIWYYIGHNSSDPVYVYPFELIGMTEYWGDSRESYGPVTTDRIQTVFLSETQTVGEIKVKEGDTVKKGDLLMTFDTTLSDLAVERKRLEVEKLKMDIEDATAELWRINSMKPMEEPPERPEVPVDPNLGVPLGVAYSISNRSDYDGSSPERAMICWLGGSTVVGGGILSDILARAEELQNYNAVRDQIYAAAAEPAMASALPEEGGAVPLDDGGVPPEGGEVPPEGGGLPPEGGGLPPEGGGLPPEGGELPPEGGELPPEGGEVPPEGGEVPPEGGEVPPEGGGNEGGSGAGGGEYVPFPVNECYVILKITAGDMSLGDVLTWQGVHLYSDHSFQFFDAVGFIDYTVTSGQNVELPEIDFGSGYTAAEIAKMRAQQQKKIQELEFKQKMTEAEYNIMLNELSDGNVYAQTDGKVISVLTEEDAKLRQQPVLKVSGGGGFVIEGSVSELERDLLTIGQEVTVSDWQSGLVYTGTVREIRDFPNNQSGRYGMENPNATQYPYVVFVDDSADLREGSYVSVAYSASAGNSGIYLETPFIRTEQGRSYVYVLGDNGRLEERTVRTGKSLWGSYIEVRDGLSQTDKIAFPYGKNVKSGAKAVEGDYGTLYGY